MVDFLRTDYSQLVLLITNSYRVNSYFLIGQLVLLCNSYFGQLVLFLWSTRTFSLVNSYFFLNFLTICYITLWHSLDLQYIFYDCSKFKLLFLSYIKICPLPFILFLSFCHALPSAKMQEKSLNLQIWT